MPKITCCDICYAEKKLTQTNRYMSMKGRPSLKVFFCEGCEKKIPSLKEVGLTGYIKWRMKLDGIDITDEQAQERAKMGY